MSPAADLARDLLAALVSLGVDEVVLSPGSRSAPLAFEALRLARAGQVRLHVRIDERSAGFLALGLAKASGRPVVVMCTSGTAVANLAPAVIEASYSAVSLVVVTADRPPEARGVGSPQTIDQIGFFGAAVRHFDDLAADAGADAAASARTRAAATGAVAAARGRGGQGATPPGPVHLNVGFRLPLVPDAWPDGAAAPAGRTGPERLAAAASAAAAPSLTDGGTEHLPARGVLLVGDLPGAGDDALHAQLADLAQACGWPVIGEPSANLHGAPTALRHGVLVLGAAGWLDGHAPDLVLSVGLFGLSRPTLGLLRRAGRHVAVAASTVGREVCDPLRTAAAVIGLPRPPDQPHVDPDWLADWRAADQVAGRVLAAAGGQSGRTDNHDAARAPVGADLAPPAPAAGQLSGLQVVASVLDAAGDRDLLLVAASWPARLVELVGARADGLRIVANRGANGIDGLVSTAWGAALAHQSQGGGAALALLGDIAFLHDHNGLLAGAGQPEPDLTVVVVDNDGGGIFHQLEQGRAQYADAFEEVFATPLGRDLVAVAEAAGVPAERVRTDGELRAALRRGASGVRVIVAAAPDRAGEAMRLDRIRHEAARMLGG